MSDYTVAFKNGEPIPVLSVFTNRNAVDLSYMKYVQDGAVSRELMQIYFSPNTDFESLKTIYRDETSLSEITITDTATENFWVHLDYVLPISLRYENITNDADIEKYGFSDWIVMELAQLTTTDKELYKLIGKNTYDKSFMTVDEYKDYLITKSKENLATYLDNTLMEYNGEYFKVTLEKQLLFMSTFTTQFAVSETNTISIVWNASGVVEDQLRNYDWCVGFINAMNAFVNPLVTEQRTFENNVKACTTKQELDAMAIPFELPQDGDV